MGSCEQGWEKHSAWISRGRLCSENCCWKNNKNMAKFVVVVSGIWIMVLLTSTTTSSIFALTRQTCVPAETSRWNWNTHTHTHAHGRTMSPSTVNSAEPMSVEVSLSREIKIMLKNETEKDQSQLSYSSIRYFCRLNVSLKFAELLSHTAATSKKQKNKKRFLSHLIQKTTVSSTTSSRKPLFLQPPHSENHRFFNHLIQKTTVSSITSFRKPPFLQSPHPENHRFFNHLSQKSAVSSATSSKNRNLDPLRLSQSTTIDHTVLPSVFLNHAPR